MRLRVCVHPGTSREKLIRKPDSSLAVYLTKKAEKGQANKALIKLLAKEFGLAKSKIRILRGEKSKSKLVEIEEGIKNDQDRHYQW